MEEDSITIRPGDSAVITCRCVIIVPDSALAEAGHIRVLTTDSSAHSKHQFHSMAQIALTQFQEGEPKVEAADGALTIQWKDEVESVAAGVVICLDSEGELRLVGNTGVDVGKLLRVGNRYATRWVRLDI